ncbi:hypothetical protein Amet_1796 [Alkaliphilus metalliredigens QYMF]|uniref:Uncharacterized protein n=1 Tax=Alkaliphilus metalliredigens (strain QYMF) TaxID=293826 RepID=A6TP48_ALKMQ|nr:hypothetical protein [Alkaliphilus metalliredigens]ABR47966.1 hypothetical protein Amet_1796 [Alkaliphilus metalliredigens QYMF]
MTSKIMSDLVMHINSGNGKGIWVGGKQFQLLEGIYQLSHEIWRDPKIEEVKSRIMIKLDGGIEFSIKWLVDLGAINEDLYQKGTVALTELGFELIELKKSMEEEE